jgi:integrase/recombinase XerD
VVLVPRQVVDRLRTYLKETAFEPEHRIFPITYAAARIVVEKAGKLAGIEL